MRGWSVTVNRPHMVDQLQDVIDYSTDGWTFGKKLTLSPVTGECDALMDNVFDFVCCSWTPGHSETPGWLKTRLRTSEYAYTVYVGALTTNTNQVRWKVCLWKFQYANKLVWSLLFSVVKKTQMERQEEKRSSVWNLEGDDGRMQNITKTSSKGGCFRTWVCASIGYF